MRLSYLTRGDSSPNGKPRVLVICHPEEYSACLQPLADDFFLTQNCAVWFREDRHVPDSSEPELTQMQLLAFAVTKRLLTEYADAVRQLLVKALSHNIPVLPVVTEHGVGLQFSEVFGNLQYLDKVTIDPTARPYPERLAAYLNSVLLNDEQISQIRAAFDAYIFLSYRKKDRAHAQELMRLIHAHPFCERVAIWYDEFLTPGEDFNESIRHALQNSQLFALVVTPNVVREQNYIIRTEYPMAVEKAKAILPIEMVETEQNELNAHFAALPEPVNGHNPESLELALRDYLQIGLRTDQNDPIHDLFVGLAYLSGIDVEVDRERAFRLISSAAEAGVPRAVKQLALMYQNGQGVKRDLAEAIRRQKAYTGILADIAEESCSEEDAAEFLREKMLLGDMAAEAEDYDTAQEAFSVAYAVAKKLSYGAFGKNIVQKTKVWFNKVILNRSPYFEEAFRALSRSALRMLELALETDIDQDIRKWTIKAINLVKTADKTFSDEQSAADLLSVCAMLTAYCMKNQSPDAALQWMQTAVACWSEHEETAQSPELRFLYARCIAAGCEYFEAVQEYKSATDGMAEIRGILRKLSGEFPDSAQFRFELIGTLITEAHYWIVRGDHPSAEECLAEAEEMLAQEDPGDAEHPVLTASWHYRNGQLLAAKGDPKAAAEQLVKGRGILEPVCNRMFDVRHSDELVSLLETLTDCRTALGQDREAQESCQRAISIQKELLQFSKSIHHTARSAVLYEKMIDICIRCGDFSRLNEWYDKAVLARDALANGVMTRGIRHKKVELPEAEAARQKLLAREAEIRGYVRSHRADSKDKLLSAIRKEPVTAAQMETEMLAFLRKYMETFHPMYILDDLYTLRAYLEQRQKSPVPDPKTDVAPYMALDRIQTRMLEHYRPLMQYEEESVIVLAFCGYYYIIRTTSGLQRKQEIMESYMRFFRDIAFWYYRTDCIRYPVMWQHLFNWVTDGDLTDPYGTGNAKA